MFKTSFLLLNSFMALASLHFLYSGNRCLFCDAMLPSKVEVIFALPTFSTLAPLAVKLKCNAFINNVYSSISV